MMDGIKLIIADDHRLFRLGLKQVIAKQSGCEVIGEAATGLEAVAAVRDLEPDIVLMDISMPELNGIEATRRISEEYPQAKVIILSMHADHRYVVEALRAGAKAYLLKDSAPLEVFAAIRCVQQGRRYVSPQISEKMPTDILNVLHPTDRSAFRLLSPREREVLQMIAEGKTTRQIADKLSVSPKTVETHRGHIMDKLNIHSVAELTKYALREGLTSMD
jgi:two-component system, NarL family, response regulator NreC